MGELENRDSCIYCFLRLGTNKKGAPGTTSHDEIISKRGMSV